MRGLDRSGTAAVPVPSVGMTNRPPFPISPGSCAYWACYGFLHDALAASLTLNNIYTAFVAAFSPSEQCLVDTMAQARTGREEGG
jgi:hypothetical protein